MRLIATHVPLKSNFRASTKRPGKSKTKRIVKYREEAILTGI